MDDWQIWLLNGISVLLFIQLIIAYNNYTSGPKRKRLLQTQKPFLDLKDVGFQAVSDAYVGDDDAQLARIPVAFLGQVDGYWVEMTYDWRTGWWHRHPNFRVRVFYSSGSYGTVAELQAITARKLAQSMLFRFEENWKLTDAYADARVYVGQFSVPAAQQLLHTAQQMVKELKKLELTPIEYRLGAELAARCRVNETKG